MSDLIQRFKEPYYKVNREERNACAMLYSFLLDPAYMKEFLEKVADKMEGENKEKADNLRCFFDEAKYEAHPYFEYAKLRDVWFYMGNSEKRKFICDKLKANKDWKYPDEGISNKDFNELFSNKVKTNKTIASPARWNHSYYFDKYEKTDLLKDIELLNWAFNAKPDIVIEFVNNGGVCDHYLCFEAKLESKESSYKGKVSQMDLQKHIFFLLSDDEASSTHIFLARQKDCKDKKVDGYLHWEEAFPNDKSGFVKSFYENVIPPKPTKKPQQQKTTG